MEGKVEKLKSRSPALMILTVMIAAFMDLLDATILSVAAPTVAASLGADNVGIQWALAAYVLAIGSGLITGGRIGDQYGHKKIFIIGLVGFTIASLLCALSPSIGWLIAARALQGLAAGMMIPQVFGTIRSTLPPKQATTAYGVYGGVLSLASIAGPLLGGLLADVDLFGMRWRAIFLINIPIGLITLYMALRYIPHSTTTDKSHLDFKGAVMAAAAVLLILLPLTLIESWGWTWASTVMIVAAALFGWLFIRYEKTLRGVGKHPIFDPAMLRNRSFSLGLIISVLFFGAIGSFFFLFSLYAQDGLGHTPWETGLMIIPYALGSIITSGASVKLIYKFGKKLLASGSIILALSLVLLYAVVAGSTDPAYWQLALPLFIGGLGLGLTAPSLVNVILAGVPGKDAGAASGVMSTASQIGNATGIAILGLLFFMSLTMSADVANYQHAFAQNIVWQIAVYVVTVVLIWWLPETMRKTDN